MAERAPDQTFYIEPVDQVYNVGQVVREYRETYIDPEPNLATAANMVALLEDLESLTYDLGGGSVLSKLNPYGWIDCVNLPDDDAQRLCRDVQRWHNRLQYYLERARSAAAANPDDRSAAFWTVTAPLFMGFFGGRTGREFPLPGMGRESRGIVGGFWPGFDPTVKQPPDLMMPFTLANQAGVALNHKIHIIGQLLDDITPPSPQEIITGGDPDPWKFALIGLGVAVGTYVVLKVAT